MKQKIKNNVNKSNHSKKKKEFKYDLTIGMIFRDDIKYIRQCLETMQPLRDACQCQLIMTDTGSVDGSKEVAKEFADILLDFEWCNDFAAARNTGVELAEGRWFGFFDCDQEFDETILKIAEFLKTKESYTADHLILPVYNYKKDGCWDDYELTDSSLIFNFQDGIRLFHGTVHETIPRTIGTKKLQANIHHWGYTSDLIETKIERNSGLIAKLIEDEPENLKNWQQYAMESKVSSIAIERANRGIEVADRKGDYLYGSYRISLRVVAYKLYEKKRAWEDCLRLEGELLQLFDELSEIGLFNNRLFQLEFYYVMTDKKIKYLTFEDNSEEVVTELIETFETYRSFYLEEQVNPDTLNASIYPFSGKQEKSYYEVGKAVLFALESNNHKEHANRFLEQVELYRYKKPNGEYLYLGETVVRALDEKVFSLLPKIYLFLYKENNEKEFLKLKKTIDRYLASSEDKEVLIGHLSEQVLDDYTALLLLVKNKFEESAFTKKTRELISEEEDFLLNPLNAHLLYGFMLTRIDPLGYVEKNDVAFMVGQFGRLVASHSDFIELIETTYADPNFVISSIKEQKLWAYLGLRACLHLAKDGAEEDTTTGEATSETTGEATDEATSEATSTSVDVKRVNRLYSQAVPLMYDYACKAYNPALLGEEGKGVVAQEELFAVYAMEAMQAESPMAMVRKLKEAMEVCPSYGPIIKLFLGEM